MRATCGIFKTRADAERAARKLRSTDLQWDRITLLVSGDLGKEVQPGHRGAADQPSVSEALGAVTSAAVPGIGPLAAVGFWGATLLGLAGVAAGVAAGSALDTALTDGRPEHDSF